MGFFQRLANLSRPRQQGSGGLWDNVNSGNVGVTSSATMLAGNATTPNRDNTFVPGPNPERYLRTGAWKDPSRLHAPFQHLLPEVVTREPRSDLMTTVYNDPQQQKAVANPTVLPLNTGAPGVIFAPTQVRQREVIYDAGDPARDLWRGQLITPSQHYFNEREAIPEYTTPSRLVHGVYTNLPQRKRGWIQAYVPEPGERDNEIGTSPPLLLSKPMNSKTTTTGSVSGHRASIQNAVAPKRHRSGG